MSRKTTLPPAPRPRKLRCVAMEKGVVVEAELQPQVTAPDVMRWGPRIFVLSEVQPKPDKVVIYREATVRRIPKPKPSPIFGAEARQPFVLTNLEPDGMHMLFNCRTCGRPRQVVATYAEILSCSFGVPPQIAFGPIQGMWAHSYENGWMPVVKCPSCPDNLQPGLSPKEIQAALEHARQAGWLPPQIEQQIKRRVVLRRRQARRRVKTKAKRSAR